MTISKGCSGYLTVLFSTLFAFIPPQRTLWGDNPYQPLWCAIIWSPEIGKGCMSREIWYVHKLSFVGLNGAQGKNGNHRSYFRHL
ncbi:hypothetical protein BC938DRAFT_483868 [Jimgerdemannia flammicorona]|uniref:Secreted protein n=1 Tax=Jimgerdemannia flammicorona TaxID=994334 RepID=A0A433QB47_9FUNG|nr:hypothetical protein BC938DRAFT_483868 [Jimgerdemannia flammicorona]